MLVCHKHCNATDRAHKEADPNLTGEIISMHEACKQLFAQSMLCKNTSALLTTQNMSLDKVRTWRGEALQHVRGTSHVVAVA